MLSICRCTYVYIVCGETSLIMAQALRHMGGVKCQPFLKHSNHLKQALKVIFKGSRCFSYGLGI